MILDKEKKAKAKLRFVAHLASPHAPIGIDELLLTCSTGSKNNLIGLFLMW